MLVYSMLEMSNGYAFLELNYQKPDPTTRKLKLISHSNNRQEVLSTHGDCFEFGEFRNSTIAIHVFFSRYQVHNLLDRMHDVIVLFDKNLWRHRMVKLASRRFHLSYYDKKVESALIAKIEGLEGVKSYYAKMVESVLTAKTYESLRALSPLIEELEGAKSYYDKMVESVLIAEIYESLHALSPKIEEPEGVDVEQKWKEKRKESGEESEEMEAESEKMEVETKNRKKRAKSRQRKTKKR